MITKEEFEKALSIVLEYQKQLKEEYEPIKNIGKIRVKKGTPLTDLNISIRTLNCLKAAELVSIEDLMYWTERDLLCLRNMGRKSVEELNELISSIILIP